MAHDPDAQVTALLALLRSEAAALRKGDLAALDGLARRKETLVAALPNRLGGAGADDLRNLRAAASANERLLRAALRGIEAARARLAAIRQTETRLDTYDSQGRARSVSFEGAHVERRA